MRLILTMIMVVAGASVLYACGVAEKMDARTNYQQSLADYRACLTANSGRVQACNGKRLVVGEKAMACQRITPGGDIWFCGCEGVLDCAATLVFRILQGLGLSR